MGLYHADVVESDMLPGLWFGACGLTPRRMIRTASMCCLGEWDNIGRKGTTIHWKRNSSKDYCTYILCIASSAKVLKGTCGFNIQLHTLAHEPMLYVIQINSNLVSRPSSTSSQLGNVTIALASLPRPSK